MRILLDESLPIELALELLGHDVASVQKMGWSGLKNGELLARAAGQFHVMLMADQNLPYQQNLDRLPIVVIVLLARSNRIEALRVSRSRRFSRARLSNLGPNPAVHSDAPVCAFVLNARQWRRAGYLIR